MSLHASPLLPVWALAALAVVASIAVLPALLARARGGAIRLAFAAALLVLLARPTLLHEERRFLPDYVLLVTDRSGSMSIGDRTAIAERARRAIAARIGAVPDLVLREASVEEAGGNGDAPEGDPAGGAGGTRLFAAIARASADIPAGRLAGVVAITDGQVHDRPARPPAAPLDVLIPAPRGETDRTLRVVQAPSYGIVGSEVTIGAVVEDHGASDAGAPVTLSIRRDGAPPGEVRGVVGGRIDIRVPIREVGQTLIELSASPLPGEVSIANDRAVVRINGVRDRLRVLLVSGEPNQGERAWRRLLKADPAVDLVHFTILRLPDREDFTPLNELALIAFPTRELFSEKINDFDLIILDRFEDRGLLPSRYLQNIADFVRRGGGLLLTAGPEFAAPGSLEDTPLGEVLPADVPQDGGVVELPFRPALTATGRAHPVTAGLPGAGDPGGTPGWGPWYRALAPDRTEGQVLMEGPGGRPLLVLARRDRGRVAMLLSDQIWLWSRGEQGGGPQAELLRRVSHWLMKEPELEEERLSASIRDGRLRIDRRSLASPRAVTAEVTAPDGAVRTVTLAADGPGRQSGSIPAASPGIWGVRAGEERAFASIEPPDPVEDADLHATADILGPIARASGGAVRFLVPSGVPEIRMTARGAASPPGTDGPIPLWRNRAHVVTGATERPLIPPAAGLAALLALAALAWWREGNG